MRELKHQVTLPLSVAFEVAMQGIRIRLGRSVVTLSGVTLGIAFLMSTLTGIAVREAVQLEKSYETDSARMASFLVDGFDPAGATVAVLQAGPLSGAEQHLLAALRKAGVAAMPWHALAGEAPALPGVRAVPLAGLAAGATATLVVGGQPSASDLDAALASATRPIVAVTRVQAGAAAGADARLIELDRPPAPEEVEKAAADARAERARNLWITAISLAVTVIGIANSMLMSVTERFREIGTMKCLGALPGFIRRIFLIESSLMGIVGGVIGALLGALVALLGFGATYGFPQVFGAEHLWPRIAAYIACSIVASLVLAVLAALYPAQLAARMVPATALKSEV